MKSTGIVRRLDELGRITIPVELRRTLDIANLDPLEIYVQDNKVILRKYNPRDVFTGATEDLYDYNGITVSKESIIKLAKMADIID